jgi:flagellar motor protein MotB
MSTQFQTQSKPSSKSLDASIANAAVKHHFSSQRGFSAEEQRYPIQTKLKIGQPGDRYEQEADRIADKVMRMPDHALQLKPGLPPAQGSSCREEKLVQPKPIGLSITPLIQRQPVEEEEEEELQMKPLSGQAIPLVQRQAIEEEEEEEEPIQTKLADSVVQRQEDESEEEEEEPIQTKRTGGQAPQIGSGLASQIRSLKGGGQSLLPTTRSFFEPSFGRDFDRVRVHTCAQASRAAKALNARAFTMGHDVVFGAGQYAPNAIEGRKLLAHELTHVVQQNAAPNAKQRVNEPNLVGSSKSALSKRAAKPRQVPEGNIQPQSGVPTVQTQASRNPTEEQRWEQSHPAGRITPTRNGFIVWNFRVRDWRLKPEHMHEIRRIVRARYAIEWGGLYGTRAIVRGHASATYSQRPLSNRTLASRRASEVRQLLWNASTYGGMTPPTRIELYARADREPWCTTDQSGKCLAKNRRVEVRFVGHRPPPPPPPPERRPRERTDCIGFKRLKIRYVKGHYKKKKLWNSVVGLMVATAQFDFVDQDHGRTARFAYAGTGSYSPAITAKPKPFKKRWAYEIKYPYHNKLLWPVCFKDFQGTAQLSGTQLIHWDHATLTMDGPKSKTGYGREVRASFSKRRWTRPGIFWTGGYLVMIRRP